MSRQLDAIEAMPWGSESSDFLDDNNARADWAWVALRAFEKTVQNKPDNEDYQTILQDLLCNLQHLCRRERLDWDAAVAWADWMHNQEEGECSDDFDPLGIGPSEHRELNELANGEIEEEVDDAPGMCQWFILCTEPATTTREHPILGDVPVCPTHLEWNP